MRDQPHALLIHPPVYDFALYDLYVKPFSLIGLAKRLRSSGYRVSLLDCLDYTDRTSDLALGKPRRKHDGTGKFHRQVVPKPRALADVPRSFARYGIVAESLRRRLVSVRPDVVMVTSGMTYWYLGVREVVRLVRQVYPTAPVLLGGIYATLCREHAERSIGADSVIPGSADASLTRVLRSHSLPELSEARKLNEARELTGSFYRDAAVLRLNSGCPYRCAYCASHLLTDRYTPGDPDEAFHELMHVRNVTRVRNFAFYDDSLLMNKNEVLLPFLEKVVASGEDFRFYVPNAAHLSLLDRDTCRLMKRAGFQEVRIGFESSDDFFHRSMGPKLAAEDLGRGVSVLREAGFRPWEIGVYVLAGLPEQHWRAVEDTIRVVGSLGVRVHLAEYSPVPGSGLWNTSVSKSSFPLVEEPLTHNNSILPLQWSGFTMDNLAHVKALAREASAYRSNGV